MVGATASTVSNPRESENSYFQPKQHLMAEKPPWNSTTDKQFAWPELELSDFCSLSSLLLLPTDLSFSQDCLLEPYPDQYQEFDFDLRPPFIAERADFVGPTGTCPSNLKPVGDFWDTTGFNNNNVQGHTFSSSTSTSNIFPAMDSRSGTCRDMTASAPDPSDNSPDKVNPSESVVAQLQGAPSNPSPTTNSPTSRSTHTTPKSNKSPSKPHLPQSPITKPASKPTSKAQKRALNTLAARRYRQKRVDQVSSLETSLKETQEECDALKLKVARLEAEVEVLRGLVEK